ncbi:MAG: hypothetical protein C0603_02190 [Denitrovibrio sp.]|nr:MAG: hypothetical protein C0603_02190 [Denitrovibrio sp.]
MLPTAHIIFLKFPETGKVKTRLGKDIGDSNAAELYRLLVERLINTSNTQSYDILLFIDPYDKILNFKNWLGDNISYHPQVGADIGERMHNALQISFDMGYKRSVLTGTDIPELDSVIITSSLESLKVSDAIIGKACDGGYYLIGFQNGKLTKTVFEGISWSTDIVFSQTMHIFEDTGLSIAQAPILGDLDDIQDLQKHKGNLKGILDTLDIY